MAPKVYDFPQHSFEYPFCSSLIFRVDALPPPWRRVVSAKNLGGTVPAIVILLIFEKKRKERKKKDKESCERRSLMRITQRKTCLFPLPAPYPYPSPSPSPLRLPSARLHGRIGEQTYRKPRIYPCGHWPAAKPPTVTQLIRIDPSATSERALPTWSDCMRSCVLKSIRRDREKKIYI